MRQTLTQIFASARLNPDRPAITLIDRVITFRMLVSGVLSVEAMLDEARLDREHVIGVAIDSPARHLIVSLALAKNGYASVALTPNLLPAAIAAGMIEALCDQPLRHPQARSVVVTEAWFTRPFGFADWALAPIDPDRVARVSFTSGSTGAPKAIGHSHRAFDQRIVERVFAQRAPGPALCSFGINSNAGFTIGVGHLTRGDNVCFDATPEEAVRFLSHANIVRLISSPARLRRIGEILRKSETVNASVREIVVGGAPIDPECFSLAKRYFTAPIYDVYASTEAGNAGVMNLSSLAAGDLHPQRFVPLAPLRIGDGASAPGEDGLIHVRSMSMGALFTGQMRLDEVDEWFAPGDVGHIDRAGYLVVTGRADHLVNSGGGKMSVEAVEAIIRGHQGVRDAGMVRQDENGKTTYWLALVAEGAVSATEIEAALARAGIEVKLSRFRIVPAIPHGASGKVDRDALRSLLSA